MSLAEMAALGALTGLMQIHLLAASAPAPELPQYPLACRIRAYIAAPGPKGLAVYAGPGEQYGQIKLIENQTDTEMLSVRFGQGNWMRISDVQTSKGQLLFAGPGWVYGPILAVSIRPGFIEGQTVNLYAEPDTRSKVTAEVPVFSSAKVLNCQGGWVKVRGAGGEGWLHPDHQCGSPGGQCS